MNKKILLSKIIVIILFCIEVNAFAEINIKYEMEKAYDLFQQEMATPISKAGFYSLYGRYYNQRILIAPNGYENEKRFKEGSNDYIYRMLYPSLWNENLIKNFKANQRFYKRVRGVMIDSFERNKSAYTQFLGHLKKADSLFQNLSSEDVLRLQIFANFVIISGADYYWFDSEQKTYVWPFCRKKEK
jgi:hypothetical protein